MIHVTSFKQAEHEEDNVWSSAVYQPHWLPQRPKADWMDIRRDDGTWIRPREHLDHPIHPLTGYFRELVQLYVSRLDEAAAWAKEQNPIEERVVICCWCPHDKAAKRQMKEFGSFVCHTAAVGFLLSNILSLPVVYDEDRELMVQVDSYIHR